MLIIKTLFKLTGWGLILFGISGGFIEYSLLQSTEDYFYIGLFLLFLSAVFQKPLTAAHQLPEIPRDAIVSNSKLWESIANESSNFKSQKLVENHRHNLFEVQTTAEAILFNLLFVLLGLFSLIVAVLVFILMEKPAGYAGIIPAIVGSVFLWFALSTMRPKKMAVFDLNKKQFFKEGEDTQDILPLIHQKSIPFVDIHGLQILEVFHPARNLHHRHSTRSHSYYSYELNLILKNSKRINVMSHGNKGDMILDAKRLAKVLFVPIWHKIEH